MNKIKLAMKALNSGCFYSDKEEDKLAVKQAKEIIKQELKRMTEYVSDSGPEFALEVLGSGVLSSEDFEMFSLAKEIISNGLNLHDAGLVAKHSAIKG
jgi:replicative superfamily II helicase